MPSAACIADEDFWTCVTVLVEAVREYGTRGFRLRKVHNLKNASSLPRPCTGVLGALTSFLESRLARGRIDSAEGPLELKPSLDSFWFSKALPAPPPLPPRFMA